MSINLDDLKESPYTEFYKANSKLSNQVIPFDKEIYDYEEDLMELYKNYYKKENIIKSIINLIKIIPCTFANADFEENSLFNLLFGLINFYNDDCKILEKKYFNDNKLEDIDSHINFHINFESIKQELLEAINIVDLHIKYLETKLLKNESIIPFELLHKNNIGHQEKKYLTLCKKIYFKLNCML